MAHLYTISLPSLFISHPNILCIDRTIYDHHSLNGNGQSLGITRSGLMQKVHHTIKCDIPEGNGTGSLPDTSRRFNSQPGEHPVPVLHSGRLSKTAYHIARPDHRMFYQPIHDDSSLLSSYKQPNSEAFRTFQHIGSDSTGEPGYS